MGLFRFAKTPNKVVKHIQNVKNTIKVKRADTKLAVQNQKNMQAKKVAAQNTKDAVNQTKKVNAANTKNAVDKVNTKYQNEKQIDQVKHAGQVEKVVKKQQHKQNKQDIKDKGSEQRVQDKQDRKTERRNNKRKFREDMRETTRKGKLKNEEAKWEAKANQHTTSKQKISKALIKDIEKGGKSIKNLGTATALTTLAATAPQIADELTEPDQPDAPFIVYN